MNSIVATLFLVGLVLLGFEVLLPGAVLGIAAGIALLAGVVVSFVEHGAQGGWLATAIAIGAVLALLYFEFRVLPRTRFGRRMLLEKSIDGASQPPVAERASDVVGREALALTALAPLRLGFRRRRRPPEGGAGRNLSTRCNRIRLDGRGALPLPVRLFSQKTPSS